MGRTILTILTLSFVLRASSIPSLPTLVTKKAEKSFKDVSAVTWNSGFDFGITQELIKNVDNMASDTDCGNSCAKEDECVLAVWYTEESTAAPAAGPALGPSGPSISMNFLSSKSSTTKHCKLYRDGNTRAAMVPATATYLAINPNCRTVSLGYDNAYVTVKKYSGKLEFKSICNTGYAASSSLVKFCDHESTVTEKYPGSECVKTESQAPAQAAPGMLPLGAINIGPTLGNSVPSPGAGPAAPSGSIGTITVNKATLPKLPDLESIASLLPFPVNKPPPATGSTGSETSVGTIDNLQINMNGEQTGSSEVSSAETSDSNDQQSPELPSTDAIEVTISEEQTDGPSNSDITNEEQTDGPSNSDSASEEQTDGPSNSDSASEEQTDGTSSSDSASEEQTEVPTSSDSASQDSSTEEQTDGTSSSDNASEEQIEVPTSSDTASQDSGTEEQTDGTSSSDSASEEQTDVPTSSDGTSQDNSVEGQTDGTSGSDSASEEQIEVPTSSDTASQDSSTEEQTDGTSISDSASEEQIEVPTSSDTASQDSSTEEQTDGTSSSDSASEEQIEVPTSSDTASQDSSTEEQTDGTSSSDSASEEQIEVPTSSDGGSQDSVATDETTQSYSTTVHEDLETSNAANIVEEEDDDEDSASSDSSSDSSSSSASPSYYYNSYLYSRCYDKCVTYSPRKKKPEYSNTNSACNYYYNGQWSRYYVYCNDYASYSSFNYVSAWQSKTSTCYSACKRWTDEYVSQPWNPLTFFDYTCWFLFSYEEWLTYTYRCEHGTTRTNNPSFGMYDDSFSWFWF